MHCSKNYCYSAWGCRQVCRCPLCPSNSTLAKTSALKLPLGTGPQLLLLRVLNRDQALSLWNGSTDSKTLGFQRTNLREYQIVRTHAKETTWIQDLASPTTSVTLCRMPHLNKNKTKIQSQSSADRITTSLSLAHQRKNNQTNKQTNKNSTNILHYRKLTQITVPTLGG